MTVNFDGSVRNQAIRTESLPPSVKSDHGEYYIAFEEGIRKLVLHLRSIFIN